MSAHFNGVSGRRGSPPTGGCLMAVPSMETSFHSPDATRALLAAIVESSDDAIISKTLDGVITSWNAGAERLFGFTAGEAVGQPITILIPHDRLHEEQVILQRLRAGQRIDHFETVRWNKDGELIDVSLTISPIRDGDGRIVGVSKIARDIRLRLRAEMAAREWERRKDEFLAIVPHELRNPLAPLLAAATLLLRNPTGEQVKWVGQLIQRQVHHMTRMVDDLLDLSRINTGRVTLRKESVDLIAVVDTAVEMIRPVIDSHRHHLEVSVPAAPVLLEADADRLCQILTNLLNNAAKYTDHGGRIDLTVERQDHAVIIRVKDNGVGIARDKQSAIFDLFEQIDPGDTRAQGGLGIGLTVARKLVQMHGGTLSLRSEGLGHGSEFTVRLAASAKP